VCLVYWIVLVSVLEPTQVVCLAFPEPKAVLRWVSIWTIPCWRNHLLSFVSFLTFPSLVDILKLRISTQYLFGINSDQDADYHKDHWSGQGLAMMSEFNHMRLLLAIFLQLFGQGINLTVERLDVLASGKA
jgi:hypothetical protein